ncbi:MULTISPECIES: Na+/H+ antiporter NhaA [Novosphingobium]|uniref:Na+/H+ antiporter NhaA n=1 Tax=Novosphingobium sp. PP1Y TaxID=702113 RepID=UPI001314F02C
MALGVGLLAVNSPARAMYLYVHHATVHVGIGALISKEPLIFWINDGLMVFFFLLAGLEIKYELVQGHLSSIHHALLPALCAAGGITVPALIYGALNWGEPEAIRGWAIPTATDVVLALSVISLAGERVPNSLRAFLMAIAIFDDIGAVGIVGLFYGNGITVPPLIGATVATLALAVLCKLSVVRIWPYAVAGIALWLCLLSAGVEAALAGLFIGLAVPLKKGDHKPLQVVANEVRPWVWFVVIPVFAFFNSGIVLTPNMFGELLVPPTPGIMLGLLLGKPLGILGVAALAVKLGIGKLPRGLRWPHILGASLIAGIGFTMSLFVAALAFPSPPLLASAKVAVLLASLLSAIIGSIVLQIGHRRSKNGICTERCHHAIEK